MTKPDGWTDRRLRSVYGVAGREWGGVVKGVCGRKWGMQRQSGRTDASSLPDPVSVLSYLDTILILVACARVTWIIDLKRQSFFGTTRLFHGQPSREYRRWWCVVVIRETQGPARGCNMPGTSLGGSRYRDRQQRGMAWLSGKSEKLVWASDTSLLVQVKGCGGSM